MVKYRVTDGVSNVVDGFANAGKSLGNNIMKKDYNYSGVYFNQNLPDAELKSWWKSAMTDLKNSLDWKEVYELEEQKKLRERLGKTL